MQKVNKDRPSPEWIAETRKRFEVEREVDRALTDKMERRAGPPYTKLPLEKLVQGVTALSGSQLKEPFEISDAKWLAGGASKLQVAFTLNWNRPGAGRANPKAPDRERTGRRAKAQAVARDRARRARCPLRIGDRAW